MNKKPLVTFAMLLVLGIASASQIAAQATGSNEKARIKASNMLGFASAEIHVVARDLEANQTAAASKSYKEARKYYGKALKSLDKANLNEEEQQALAGFKSRAEDLELDTETLTASKVDALVSLIDEIREYFKVSG